MAKHAEKMAKQTRAVSLHVNRRREVLRQEIEESLNVMGKS